MRELTSRVHGRNRLAAVAGLLVALAGCAGETSGTDTPSPTVYSVSGTISGAVAAGVTVTIQGGLRKTTTNAVGGYSIGGLPNGTYTLEAALDGYTFTPPTRSVTVNGANVTAQDFTSQTPPPPPPPGISIAGQVTGEGPEGVTLTLVGPEPATSTQTAITNAGGSYEFPDVASGIYLLTPSRAGGWTFSPANALVTVAGTSLTGPDFVSIAATHGLSGRVTGAFTAGVIVTLSGDADAVTVTDASGSYAFTELAPGDYVVTAAYPGYAFTPAERTATVGTSDVTGQDFASVATHRIAGRISGDVIQGVTVSLSGTATGDATTDASGYFEFADLVDGAYVVRPSLDGYTFGPPQRSVTLSGANVVDANFTASVAPPATYSVSGSVSGDVQGGVTVTLQGDPTAVTTTDGAGAFAFEAVQPGNYLIVPSHDDYTFDPASRFVVVAAANVTGQAFIATVSPSARTIAGNLAGDVTAGVTVTLVGPSPATTTQTTTTDAEGSFAFRGLVDGLYLVTPSLAGFAFIPADCLVSVAGPSVMSVQFTSAFAPHSISGRVTGPVIAGVTIGLSGAASDVTSTAPDGTYTFTGLSNGSYTVTPLAAGHYFSPVEAPVALDGADVSGVDFVSAPAHTISGHVSGDVRDGVTVTLSGAAGAETTTDGTGFYEFTGLPDGGYLLTASLDGYTFAPRPLPIDLAGADVTTADFTSTLIPTYTVSGTISGAVLQDVTLELSGASSKTAATDATGAYVFTGLPNGSYMVIPSLGGYQFTPASRAFRIDDADVSGQDFTSAVAP
jgi:hypothetical protein